jgi:inhibitor of cysteine peptidase
MNRVVLPLLLVLIMFCGSCASRTVSIVVQGDDDRRSSVALCKGCELTVNLAGNPTTGYIWEIVAIDPGVLRQVGEAEFRSEQTLIGSGGTMIFRFTGIEAGSTSLKFVYHRPFEKNMPPIRTRELQVVVSR